MRKYYSHRVANDIDWLMQMWDWEKNTQSNIFPTEVRLCSKQKIWVHCEHGHTWLIGIGEVYYRHSNCPYCNNRKVWSGLNDLQTICPEVALDWHPTKNGDLTPDSVLYKSTKLVWWKCHKCGREWQSPINQRTVGDHRGCMTCNCGLSTSFPEQAIFYYVKQVYPNAVSRYRDIFPHRRSEIDIYIPEIRTGIEYDGIRFHNHENNDVIRREATKYKICHQNNIYLIRILEDPNPKISFQQTCDNSICLPKGKTKDESLALLISYLLTYELGRNQKFLPRDFDGYPPIDINIERDRYNIQQSYLYDLGDHSFASEYPEYAKLWHPTKNGNITPSMVPSGSTVKYWWKCQYCGKDYLRTIEGEILSGGRGCKKCSMTRNGSDQTKKYISSHGSFAILHPNIAKQWHPTKNGDVTPDMVSGTSIKRYWWLCPVCGYEWQASLESRAKEKGPGCPACSGRVPLVGINDFATLYPDLLKEWDYSKNTLEPSSLLPQSNKRVWWVCSKCGYSWQTMLGSRTSRHTSCPRCIGQVPYVGVDDLATLYPDLLKEWDYSKNKIGPENFKASSGKKVWWKCSVCGHEWLGVIANRTKGKGCRICGYKKAGATRHQSSLEANKTEV